ncbi:hypothetical protein DFH05DRAFT_1522556 [Lentinula detonsa]|uniref:Uncharacterized protein n=1 Tax=Lentinula detonsa TaxID=2804962 RepID=A0A9W8P6W4_9AGAR|nr:hypothetical protein DFH05DRAFT_1522556 [Lentinula detonsa]
MALREMALVWDMIEPDLQKESEGVKEKPKKEFLQAGGFGSSTSHMLFDAQEIMIASEKSPFAYLEWHKEIDEGIINGKVALNLRSLSVHLAGVTITGGDPDTAARQKSMNSTTATESESLTQSPNLIQVISDAEETDILLLTPSNKVNVCRDTVQQSNNETSDVPTAEEVGLSSHGLRSNQPVNSYTCRPQERWVGEGSSNVTHRSVKRELRQLVRVAGPTAAYEDSTKPLTIRIPPVTAQDPANFYHNGRPSSPLTLVLQQASPRPPLKSKKTVSVAPLSIHGRSAANTKRTFSSK